MISWWENPLHNVAQIAYGLTKQSAIQIKTGSLINS